MAEVILRIYDEPGSQSVGVQLTTDLAELNDATTPAQQMVVEFLEFSKTKGYWSNVSRVLVPKVNSNN